LVEKVFFFTWHQHAHHMYTTCSPTCTPLGSHVIKLKTMCECESGATCKNHRRTRTTSASCLTRFSTTPSVVLQRRISSATGANQTTQRQSAQSHREQEEQHSNFKLRKSFLSTHANCDAKSLRVQLLTAHCLSGGGGGGGVFSRANSTKLLTASDLSGSLGLCLPETASSVTLNC
jgi:hypothetical protein